MRIHHVEHDLLAYTLKGLLAKHLTLLVKHRIEHRQNGIGNVSDLFFCSAFTRVEVTTSHSCDPSLNSRQVPLICRRIVGAGLLKHLVDAVLEVGRDVLPDYLAVEDGVALVVDCLALEVHHIVVLKHILARREVHRLNLLLGGANDLRDQLVFKRLRIVHATLDHHVGNNVEAISPKQAQELVLKREEEARLARVALAPGTPTQLVVDAARLVALGPNHVEPTEEAHCIPLALNDVVRFGLGSIDLPRLRRLLIHPEVSQSLGLKGLFITTEQDVGATPCHVGRNRHSTKAPCLGNNRSFLLRVFRVQGLVFDATFVKDAREALRRLDGSRAHQNRLALLVALGNLVGNRFILRVDGAEDEVCPVFANDRLVRWHRHNGEVVDLLELAFFGQRRARHAGEFLVEAEVVLQGHRGKRARLFLNLDVLLGLNGLVEAL